MIGLADVGVAGAVVARVAEAVAVLVGLEGVGDEAAVVLARPQVGDPVAVAVHQRVAGVAPLVESARGPVLASSCSASGRHTARSAPASPSAQPAARAPA